VERLRRGDAAALSRCLSLVEQGGARADAIGRLAHPATGRAAVVGFSGPPGAGKSTLIDAYIARVRAGGRSVAVAAVDPSSPISGGSVLGDRVRMQEHATDEGVFIRSMATRGHLGGLAWATPQALRVLDAAGCDVVLLETVGVGQSEVTVAGMVDTFLFLPLARTGDQLQGIKKGVLELADVVVVNKADGEHATEAKAAARELSGAIRLIYPRETLWRPPVLTMSALEGRGVTEMWETVLKHRRVLTEAGEFDARRTTQQVDWTWSMVRDTVLDRVLNNPEVRRVRTEIERQVRDGELTPTLAAQQILDAAEKAKE
jgi:LAO/AO transport system kinase